MDWNFNLSINVVSIFNNIFSWNFNYNFIRNFLGDFYVFGNLFKDLEFSRLLVKLGTLRYALVARVSSLSGLALGGGSLAPLSLWLL